MTDPIPKPRRRPLGYMKLMGLCALFGLIVGGLSGVIGVFGGSAADPLRIGLMVIGMGFVLYFSVIWWRGADEAVREAHKWAWYWGGSVGIAVGGLALAILASSGTSIPLPPLGEDGPAGYVLTGIALILGLQMIGYLIAWAAWWLRHR